MEQQKKRYKAVSTESYGPFEGWMIEELDEEEYAKEEAKEKEIASKTPGRMSPEELEQKRQEQLAKIKALVEGKKTASTTSTPVAPVAPTKSTMLTEEELEKKHQETGIPVEVLRMIEKKKEEIRNRKSNS